MSRKTVSTCGSSCCPPLTAKSWQTLWQTAWTTTPIRGPSSEPSWGTSTCWRNRVRLLPHTHGSTALFQSEAQRLLFTFISVIWKCSFGIMGVTALPVTPSRMFLFFFLLTNSAILWFGKVPQFFQCPALPFLWHSLHQREKIPISNLSTDWVERPFYLPFNAKLNMQALLHLLVE